MTDAKKGKTKETGQVSLNLWSQIGWHVLIDG